MSWKAQFNISKNEQGFTRTDNSTVGMNNRTDDHRTTGQFNTYEDHRVFDNRDKSVIVNGDHRVFDFRNLSTVVNKDRIYGDGSVVNDDLPSSGGTFKDSGYRSSDGYMNKPDHTFRRSKSYGDHPDSYRRFDDHRIINSFNSYDHQNDDNGKKQEDYRLSDHYKTYKDHEDRSAVSYRNYWDRSTSDDITDTKKQEYHGSTDRFKNKADGNPTSNSFNSHDNHRIADSFNSYDDHRVYDRSRKDAVVNDRFGYFDNRNTTTVVNRNRTYGEGSTVNGVLQKAAGNCFLLYYQIEFVDYLKKKALFFLFFYQSISGDPVGKGSSSSREGNLSNSKCRKT